MIREAKETPVYAIEARARRNYARGFLGEDVELVIAPHRTKETTRYYEGRVVAVAIVQVGTVADVIVLATPGNFEQAFSLATVRRIRRLPK